MFKLALSRAETCSVPPKIWGYIGGDHNWSNNPAMPTAKTPGTSYLHWMPIVTLPFLEKAVKSGLKCRNNGAVEMVQQRPEGIMEVWRVTSKLPTGTTGNKHFSFLKVVKHIGLLYPVSSATFQGCALVHLCLPTRLISCLFNTLIWAYFDDTVRIPSALSVPKHYAIHSQRELGHT